MKRNFTKLIYNYFSLYLLYPDLPKPYTEEALQRMIGTKSYAMLSETNQLT